MTDTAVEIPTDLLTPLGAYLRLREAGPAFLLESVERGRLGRYSFVGYGSRTVSFEEAETLGGKLNMQLTWYGGSRSLLTAPYAEELLLKAGFSAVHHASFRETGAPYPGITALDNRPKESFFIEAVK